MSSTSPASETARARSLPVLPKQLWAAVAALALTTAALGGALVQRSLVHAGTATPVASPLQPPVSDGPGPTSPQPMTSAPRPASSVANADGAQQVAQAPVARCAVCGTVESVRAVRIKGRSTGIGAVGGALTGGILGHQFGGGSGRTGLTIVGAAGGALAGREVERNVRAVTVYDVRVRMQDGTVRLLRRSASVAPGTPVRVEGSRLRVAGGASRAA